MASLCSTHSPAGSPRDESMKDPAWAALQRSMSAELEGMLLRALEMGVQKAAELFGKNVCVDAMSCGGCVTEIEAARLASMSSCGLSPRIGYYGNADIIAHLLHLIVQLALYPRPPSADAVLQVHSRSARTAEQSIQIGSAGIPASKEVQVPSLKVQASLGQPGLVGTSPDGGASAKADGVAVADGQAENQDSAVRIGGGWHVIRNSEQVGSNQSIGLSPRRSSCSPSRSCSVSHTSPEERHPFAHGAPSRQTPRHRFTFGAYAIGAQHGYTVSSVDPARLAKEVSRGRLRPRYGLYRVLRPRSALGSSSSCSRITKARKGSAAQEPSIWPDLAVDEMDRQPSDDAGEEDIATGPADLPPQGDNDARNPPAHHGFCLRIAVAPGPNAKVRLVKTLEMVGDYFADLERCCAVFWHMLGFFERNLTKEAVAKDSQIILGQAKPKGSSWPSFDALTKAGKGAKCGWPATYALILWQNVKSADGPSTEIVAQTVVRMAIRVSLPGRSPSVSPCTASSGEEQTKRENVQKEAAAKKQSARPAKAAAKQKQLPKKDGPKEEEKEVPAETSEKMRAALQALKQRRADLDAAHQQLDTSKSQIEELRQQLRSVRADLESERAAKASATQQLESALETVNAELQAAELAKASLASEAMVLRSQEKERAAEIEQLQKVCAESRAFQSELGQVRSQLERVLQEKSAAVKDAEALRTRASVMKSELEAVKKSEGSLTSEVAQLRAALGDAKAKASSADMELRVMRKDLEDARRAQAQTEELARRTTTAAAEARRAGLLVADPLGAEVEAAWKALVGSGLDRLQQALFSAGLLQAACQPSSGKFGVSDATDISLQDVSAARKPKREREEKGERRDRADKKDKKDSVGKKAKRDRKGKKERKKDAEEGKDVDDPRASRRLQAEMSGSSSNSDVEVGQLHGIAGPSILRAASGHAGHRPKGSRNVSFTVPSQVDVVSYRACGEALWFPNPQSNVLCERCKRRVPQRLGQLRGGNGNSSFMCDEFFCDDCFEKLTLSK
ncbi:unnamed protein product [Symbiodinium pilosum]|uniref:Uncharacterized protein n=1 Tax=Symbiodinium pilosum TaxID=2952 RepID=A0A812VG98_SYMPI|nr:unnamed protein product [Symbiodinium pilosum]